MNTLKVKVILGSTRQGRFSEIPGAWIMEQLKAQPGVEAELLDLRDYPMPFFEEAMPPSAKKEEYPNPIVEKWRLKVADGDAYIVIAPEYNHGYSAVLKNALDYVYPEWNKKAIGFVSYGSAMGARVVEQLREVAVELQMAPVRAAIHMPWDTVVKTRENASEGLAPYTERAKGLIEQLLWWGNALKTARNAS